MHLHKDAIKATKRFKNVPSRLRCRVLSEVKREFSYRPPKKPVVWCASLRRFSKKSITVKSLPNPESAWVLHPFSGNFTVTQWRTVFIFIYLFFLSIIHFLKSFCVKPAQEAETTGTGPVSVKERSWNITDIERTQQGPWKTLRVNISIWNSSCLLLTWTWEENVCHFVFSYQNKAFYAWKWSNLLKYSATKSK